MVTVERSCGGRTASKATSSLFYQSLLFLFYGDRRSELTYGGRIVTVYCETHYSR